MPALPEVAGGRMKRRLAGVRGQLAPVGNLLVARDGEHAFPHVVLAHDGEGVLGLHLPAFEREHVELAVAELARVGGTRSMFSRVPAEGAQR